MQPQDYYKESLRSLNLLIKQIKKKELILSISKIFLIILISFLIINYKSYSIIPFLVSLLVLIIISTYHEIIIKKRKLLVSSKKIDETELKILNGEFKDLNNGSEFSDIEHNYSDDLDLFANGGLFQYINRAKTSFGMKILADWLKNRTENIEIEKRQEAVIELNDELEFRKNIQIHGEIIEDDGIKQNFFIDFFNNPIEFASNKFVFIIIKIIPIFTLLSLYLSFTGFHFSVFMGFFVIQLSINLFYAKRNSLIYNLSKKSYKVLAIYSRIIKEIEVKNFKSGKLIDLRKKLFVANRRASYFIRKIAILLEWFELRNSSIHFLVNNILFWDLNLAFKIEKWRDQVSGNVDDWFSVIGQFEALSSLATLKYNNPDWSMPIFNEDITLNAENMGHPLISKSERIINSLSINKGNIIIITGPNMAGKSTFLRSIGVNIVLAQAGSPVCSSKFVLSPVDIYTSMKISDSLDKKMSLFYAELSRLKKIIDSLKTKKTFFLIDEMLKGTNVIDRQKGSLALMRQLIKNNVNGILATHDLKLSELEDEYEEEKISNYHFDSFINGENLEFDYKLKNGVCKSFNAHILMKNMGIEIV